MQKVTLANLNLLPNRLVITEKLFVGFAYRLSHYRHLVADRNVSNAYSWSSSDEGLLAVPRLLVICAFRTSLVVCGCRTLAFYVLETVHVAGRFGIDRRLRCLIVSIHTSTVLLFFFRTVCVKSYE